jgi:hypothetical protein
MTIVQATAAALLLSAAVGLGGGSVALAQGYGPGVNPNNQNDMLLRSNPQNLTLPGGSNPQDLVRPGPAIPRVSPAPTASYGSSPPLSSSLQHTYTVEDTDKPHKKIRRKKP